MKEQIMKKSMIAALVAVAAFGFSGTSFAAPMPPMGSGLSIGDIAVALTDIDTTVDASVDSSINAADSAPAAGGAIGQVAYDAPAVGGDMIDISAIATAIQLGDVASQYPTLASVTSGAVDANGAAGGNAASEPGVAGIFGYPAVAAAGGDGGNAMVMGASTGAVSIGDINIDLSNSATALAVGGSYNYGVQP
jgi:hypothetical protein